MNSQNMQRRNNAQSRRLFLATTSATFVVSAVQAQTPTSPFVGKWKGEIPGLGESELTITVVHQTGWIEGSMLSGHRGLTFGERLDLSRGISQGTVRGSTLAIETAVGGSYQFNLAGNELSGTYSRGTTHKVPVSLKRS